MSAAAMKKNQQTPPVAATTVVDDPKFEWTEKANSYVLRLALPGFRKDEFRVQVDGFSRLTVRSSRPAAAGQSSINKVFPLPSDASLEDIKGRFEAGVLTLYATKKNQQTPPAPAGTSTGGPTVVDPKFEWAEKAGSYVLRLALPGFRKDDFRVQVDGAGRLTVRGARPAATGQESLHKVFQLPASASLDDIAGRFEAGMLTLTVGKRTSASAGAAALTSIEDIKRKQPSVPKEEGFTCSEKKGDADAKEEFTGSVKKTADAKEEMGKEDASKNAMEEANSKAQEKKRKEEEEAKPRKQEQQKPASATVKNEEPAKPKSPQAVPLKPEAATGADKAKAAVATESLAERVSRQGQEERAKAAAAATAAMKAISEPEKKATTSGWKERVAGELKGLTNMKWAEGLTDMKWADGVVEAARNNKEVVAVGVAAFSLGFFISQRLFRK